MRGPDCPEPERVVILNDFSSVEGGAGYLAATLAKELAASGMPVTYISGDAGSQDWPQGVAQVALGSKRLLDGGALAAAMRGLYNRAAADRVRHWIAQHDTPRTIYHLHNWSNILSPAIFDVLAPVVRRCVIHAHDFFLACPNGTYLDYPKVEVCQRTPLSPGCLATNCDKRSYSHKLWRVARQRLLFTKLRPHLRDATFVMIHPAMRPWLTRAIRPEHMIAIRNPVTPFGPPVKAPEQQRRILHIGQVQRLKGVYELAEAGHNLGVAIDFFGTGEDLADLQALYPEHVYHGWTDRAEIARHMQTARAVVVATQSPEPFCLAAFESTATGLPLVVSDAILAAPDLIESGAALPFSAGDVAALTAVLGRVVADNALVARLADCSRRPGAAAGNTLETWVSAHKKLYAELTAQTDPPLMKDNKFAAS